VNFNWLTDNKIIITGATGWVGRSFLDTLQRIIPSSSFNSQVLAIGSKQGMLHSTAYPQELEIEIPVFSLEQLPDLVAHKPICLVHSAFLTKDRLSEYGYREFVRINQSITNIVCDAISRASSARVVEISSGAALVSLDRKEDSLESAKTDPYGFLKLQEESRVSVLAETQVFRIFALSGRFIRNPNAFALGDFLLNALMGNVITIQAKSPVVRGYVNASDVAKCALSWLFSGDAAFPPCAAINEIVSLHSLARRISCMYNLPPAKIPDLDGLPSSYSHSPLGFMAMCLNYAFLPIPLHEQILDTAVGIRRFI
jgi:nucleoside-diphosphate-sugar epimerase